MVLSLATRSLQGRGDVVERRVQPIKHVLNLALRDDERRAEGDRVVREGADDEAALEGACGDLRREAGRVLGLGCLVGDEFDGADQTDAARL